MSNKKKRISMDDLAIALDELTPLEENNKKLSELIQQIKILNDNITKLLSNQFPNSNHETTYIS